MKRPLTVKETQAEKQRLRDLEKNKVKLVNPSKWQTINVQLYGKNSKSSSNQITIQLYPGKSVELPEYRLIKSQIDNLRKKGAIRVERMSSVNNIDFKDFVGKTPAKIIKGLKSKTNKNG
jgi:hypothetical protein